jgi:hypothetical protein
MSPWQGSIVFLKRPILKICPYLANASCILITYWPSTGKYPTEVLLYWPRDSEVNTARPRLEIFPYTVRTVEVCKFFIIWHSTFVKKWKKCHARAKYKVRNIWKKTIGKNVLLVSKTTALYSTFYIEYYNTVWIVL